MLLRPSPRTSGGSVATPSAPRARGARRDDGTTRPEFVACWPWRASRPPRDDGSQRSRVSEMLVTLRRLASERSRFCTLGAGRPADRQGLVRIVSGGVATSTGLTLEGQCPPPSRIRTPLEKMSARWSPSSRTARARRRCVAVGPPVVNVALRRLVENLASPNSRPSRAPSRHHRSPLSPPDDSFECAAARVGDLVITRARCRFIADAVASWRNVLPL